MMNHYEDFGVAALFSILAALIIFLFRKLLENRKRKIFNDSTEAKSGHYWTPIELTGHGYFCANCKVNLTTGYECDYCTLRVHHLSCIKELSLKTLCKVNYVRSQMLSDEQKSMPHHWIHGTIEDDKFCCICEELCGGGFGLNDYRCSWCCRVVHAECFKYVGARCDFGDLVRHVISPLYVTTRRSGNRSQKSNIIDEIMVPPEVEDWCPIIAIVNPKSGSGSGKEVLRKLRTYLHPCQVMDVTKSSVKVSLSWVEKFPEIKPRVLIAGGDGTISLVLNDIDQLQYPPPVAILPLGTGNDLSRVLGWGKMDDGLPDVLQLMKEISSSSPKLLDRWTLDIVNNRKLGVRFSNKTLSLTNYASIGVDACVTLGMQTTRESIPRALSSRLLNKLLFFTYGTKDVFERACNGLKNKIDLYLDDSEKPLDLPEIEGLVFLNIGCWGAGVKPWDNAPDTLPQSLDDGKFEIFGVTSSFHIAQLQVGLSSPLYLGQASKVLLKVKNGPIPMQSDGEAWMQNPATIYVSNKGRSLVLERNQPISKGFF